MNTNNDDVGGQSMQEMTAILTDAYPSTSVSNLVQLFCGIPFKLLWMWCVVTVRL